MVPQAKKQPRVEQLTQLQDLHYEIRIIKENHLAHMAQDIDNLSVELTNTKASMDKRFDKLDNRMWVLLGLTVSTLVSIIASVAIV